MIKTLAQQIVGKVKYDNRPEFYQEEIEMVESLLTSFVEELVGPNQKELSEPWTDERYEEDAFNKFRDHLRQKAKGEA